MPNWSEILKELEDCKRVDALDYSSLIYAYFCKF